MKQKILFLVAGIVVALLLRNRIPEAVKNAVPAL
jgi:hypothetical protein